MGRPSKLKTAARKRAIQLKAKRAQQAPYGEKVRVSVLTRGGNIRALDFTPFVHGKNATGASKVNDLVCTELVTAPLVPIHVPALTFQRVDINELRATPNEAAKDLKAPQLIEIVWEAWESAEKRVGPDLDALEWEGVLMCRV